jgi:hypothetical protein
MSLRIIIHLLETIYTLSYASSVLDTSIETFDEFKTLVDNSIMNSTIRNGQVISLKGLLGKDYRRIENIAILEQQFVDEITLGIIEKISLDQQRDPNGKYLYKIIK